MALDVSKLTAAVAKLTTVEASVLKLVSDLAANEKSLAAQLAAAIAANDPVALAAVQKAIDDSATQVDASANDLAASVTANTPAA